MKLAFTATVILGVLSSAGTARGDTGTSILFARGTSLWRMDIGSKTGPEEIVRVDEGAIERIEASDKGTTVLIETDDEVRWARPGEGKTPVSAALLDCRPRAHLSPDGTRVACMDRSGNRVLIRLDPSPRKIVYGAAMNTHIGFGGGRLISSDDKGVWAAPTGRSHSGRALLAREPPHSDLLVAPDGKRAVGVYIEDQSSALYIFQLDGKGIRRRLMKGAEPVAWSRNSRWLLVQTKKSACLVRAVGGEYKCWRRYRAVGIAPDGSYALLAKEADSSHRDKGGYDLYRGRRDGVRPDRPELIRSNIHAATWIAD